MPTEQELLASHRGWLGNLTAEQVGLTVNAPALVRAQAYFDKTTLPELQQRFLTFLPALSGKSARDVEKTKRASTDEVLLEDIPALLRDLFDWPVERTAGVPGGPALPDLVVRLENYGDDRLEPTYALLDEAREKPLMLVRVEPPWNDLDKPLSEIARRWTAKPQDRFVRLLQSLDVPMGLLTNGRSIRLVYAPRTETAGHLSFPVELLTQTAGRDVLGAMVMLFRDTLLLGPSEGRLPAILRASRKFQNEVSTELAEQVLSALSDLLSGFQAARTLSGDEFLREELSEHPDHVYGGLLTTLMRLVFILYAEDRGLLPSEPIFVNNYSITGLYERLRDDEVRFPDTMDQRYGAWQQVISLFSMMFFGARHKSLRLPKRLGELFDPNRYPFLEGRRYGTTRGERERVESPKVSDGVVYRVLHRLLFLKHERISYRALNVEQIGSVYEAMMGFTLEVASGPSLAVKPHDVVVNLDELLRKKPDDRLKVLSEVDCKVTGHGASDLKKAKTLEEVEKALEKQKSHRFTSRLEKGTLYLQPTAERRRSGSHYTPPELTRPIVKKTLAPLLARFSAREGGARAEDILAFKVCDPAMGSGAFLVEVCRQLGEALEEAWKRDPGSKPSIPPDEEDTLHAMRLVAQRCLYGVDKNPFAVALAKLSLWLVTLAKDHPFTFLDHSLREGDSLVGLGRGQITSFHWDVSRVKTMAFIQTDILNAIRAAEQLRGKIHALGDSDDTDEKRRLLDDADSATEAVRRIGDLVIEAFFQEKKDKDREKRLSAFASKLTLDLGKLPLPALGSLRPFHWEIEFPEVFLRENPGFDCFVGNPPFAGKNTILASGGELYIEWLKQLHEGAHGNADLVAHFFRRAFDKLRDGGTFGLIATNTIAQGDTRASGLRWICQHDGVIYDATRRYKWPGLAAVIVSVIHVHKGKDWTGEVLLDGRAASRISAFLFHEGQDNDPVVLKENEDKSFQGSIVLGMGFTFDDSNPEATPIAEMRRLIEKDPRNQERIFPYLGGEELNSDPEHRHHRYVINFGQMSEEEARAWPDLMAIVEEKVKPARLAQNREVRAKYWWRFGESAPALYKTIANLKRVLANSQVSSHLVFAFQPTDRVFAHTLNVFAFSSDAAFTLLQSRPHELWARFFGSSMKDDLRYTASNCFETFPFPPNWQTNAQLEAIGQEYYEYRAALMISNNQGLTATYNRFHDPDETENPQILRMREMHERMDRAVLDAYGWTDIRPDNKFLLDYEEEDNDEPAKKSNKKRPWRYRWPDEVRDEVLARLLALNQERARLQR